MKEKENDGKSHPEKTPSENNNEKGTSGKRSILIDSYLHFPKLYD